MVLLATVVSFACGCAVSHKTATNPSLAPGPLQTATKAQLIELYDHQAQAVQSLNAAVTMKLTAGSAYSGVIEQYHDVNGFVLAARPASIRVIGQAPVISKNVFDMVSDGMTFSIYIPSKNKFIVGPANLERHAEKPIANLRPQHLTDAFFWPPIPERAPVLMEEASEENGRYYVLTVVRRGAEAGATNDADSGSMDWQIARKIWFSRGDLRITRIENFGPDGGKVASDVRYGNWQPAGSLTYPWQIAITRPGDDYQLQIVIKKLTVNEPVGADRFVLAQPPGTELVRVGEEAAKSPAETPKEQQH
jgi:outer membrane lipoprotein-sorting protein